MKTCMKQLLLLAMIFVTITATGSNTPQQQSKSGATQEFRAAVRALLDATEYEKTMKERMVSAYKQLGQEDNPYIDDFMNQLIEKMPDKMVDIYSKYFTLDEIKQLTEINKTEIQTKIRNLQPQISQDLMQEGQCFAKGEKSPSADIVVEKDFEEAVREYLQASGFDNQMKQMQSVLENFYKIPSGLLDGSLDKLSDHMPDMTIRIYSKYFTTNEIKQAIALAKTPCLKKFNEKTIAITQDILEVTEQLSIELMEKILADETQKNDKTQTEKSKGWFLEKMRPLNQ